MMANINIVKLIRTLGDEAVFVGKADENRINFIEQELGVILPASYKSFLREYGLAVLPGFVILGNGLSAVPACLDSTLDWRKYGLPPAMVVIEDEGTDWIFCLETSKNKFGECPVVDWEQNHGNGKESFENFSDFFEARLKESLTLI
jgi:hypothetical protein